MSRPLVLVDPAPGPFWPLATARPVADLLAGTHRFHERWAHRSTSGVAAVICDPAVQGCAFRGTVAVATNQWPAVDAGLAIARSTWIPPTGWRFGDESGEYRCDGEAVAWVLDGARAQALVTSGVKREGMASRLGDLGLPVTESRGRFVASLPEMITVNPQLLAADGEAHSTSETVTGVDPVTLLGDGLRVGADVTVGPFVTIDTEPGPVILDDRVRVRPMTVLRGPLYVGPDSVLLGGEIGSGTSIGPRCRIRGEVEQSIVQGFTNKGHEGFLGHTALGEWVNLGAGTTTSDLKNTYGPVRLKGVNETIETGVLKLGSMIGDHVKTGIGTMLTTGARIGLGSHVYGAGVAPAFLPAFSWYDGKGEDRVRLDAFLDAAAIAMGRRDQALTQTEIELLRSLHASASGC